MKRNYQFRSGKPVKSQNKGQILLVLMSFVTGYLSSTIFNMNQLEAWLNNGLKQVSSYAPKPVQIAVNTPKSAPTPQAPKLEFYTVLTKADKHVLPANPEIAQANEKTAAAINQIVVTEESKKTLVPVEVAKQIPPEIPKPKELPRVANKGGYVVQLASFRYYAQADKFRAKLILKGFDVKISAIRQGTMQWYRVMLGPYASIHDAQKAKLIFQAKEHAPGMIRQMDA
jgi:cell division protein FtsN